MSWIPATPVSRLGRPYDARLRGLKAIRCLSFSGFAEPFRNSLLGDAFASYALLDCEVDGGGRCYCALGASYGDYVGSGGCSGVGGWRCAASTATAATDYASDCECNEQEHAQQGAPAAAPGGDSEEQEAGQRCAALVQADAGKSGTGEAGGAGGRGGDGKRGCSGGGSSDGNRAG